jgi:hypothetical protein
MQHVLVLKFSAIILLVVLAIVVYQDIKFRLIHIVLPLLITCSAMFSVSTNKTTTTNNIASNSAFFIISLLIVVIYMSLKNKKILNPFKHYFGMGDFLFFVAITPLFHIFNYIVFFILAMLFAIVAHTLTQQFSNDKTVPLAGFAALLLIVIITSDLSSNLYHLSNIIGLWR